MHNVAASVREILQRLPAGLPIEVKDSFVALSIGHALSLTLPLPTSPVTSINAYYANTHNNGVCEVVSAFNEHYIIDAKQTCDLVFRFYKLRYQLAHEPMAIAPLFAQLARCCDDVIPKVVLDNENTYGTTEAQDAFNVLMWEFKKEFNEGSSCKAIGATAVPPPLAPTQPT